MWKTTVTRASGSAAHRMSRLSLLRAYPELVDCSDTFLELRVDQRKEVIRCIWLQPQSVDELLSLPSHFPLFCSHDKIIYSRRRNGGFVSMVDLIENLLPFLQDPIHAGIVMSLLLSTPMLDEDITAEFRGSLYKEVEVMERRRPPSQVNWGVLFGSEPPQVPLASPYEPNPSAVLNVRYRLRQWRSSLENMVLYPRLNHKFVSRSTERALSQCQSDMFGREPSSYSGNRMTQWDVEFFEHRYRYRLGGVCEVRQNWTRSDIKPRTYYAVGGRAFRTSRLLQRVFTSLCDYLIVSERHHRVSPTVVEFDHSEDTVAYDYSSFTSAMSEQYYFLLELASFCQGVTVYTMDPVEGMLERDLSELLMTYVEECNNLPEYSLERMAEYTELAGGVHGIAGFLGVHGNLASCTSLHAIGLLIAKTPRPGLLFRQTCVAGDDAFYADAHAGSVLCRMLIWGTFAFDKCFWVDDERPGIVLKRRLQRIQTFLTRGALTSFPHLGLFDKTILGDRRYPRMSDMTTLELQRTTASSMLLFLKDVHAFRHLLGVGTIDRLAPLLRELYDMAGLPLCGNVPAVPQSKLGFFVPSGLAQHIGEEPFQATISQFLHADVSHLGPVFQTSEEVWRGRYEVGISERMCMTSHLSYLRGLGYVTAEECRVFRYGRDACEFLIALFRGDFRFLRRVYDVCVLEEIPEDFRYPLDL